MARKPASEELEEQKPPEPAAATAPAVYCVNADRSRVVPCDSPEAALSFPASDPGAFAELLKAHLAGKG